MLIPRRILSLLLCSLALAVVGCSTTVNTLPPLATATDPAQHYTLDLPEGLEVKSVDFDATLFSNVSGSGTNTSTSLGGRAFVKVYAVDRQTGEQYLLLYENIARRTEPTQVIRFRETGTE